MKSRYKVLVVALVVVALLVAIVVLLGYCFHKVEYGEYALAHNVVWDTMTDTQARTYGRYFLGLDMELYRFPRGLHKEEFDLQCLTADKTPIRVRALFLGRLLQSKILSLYQSYGVEGLAVLRLTVQQHLIESVENVTVVQLVGNRSAVENSIASYIKNRVETAFPYVYVDHFSLGELGTDIPNSAVLTQNPTLYQLKNTALEGLVSITKQLMFLNNGGAQLLLAVESQDASMFNQIAGNFSSFFTTNLTNSLNVTEKLNVMLYALSHRLTLGSQTIYINI